MAIDVRQTDNIILTAYDIRKENVIIYPINYYDSLMNMMGGILGAGIFTMGVAFQNGGLWFTLFFTVYVGSLCLYNMHALVICSDHIKKKLELKSWPNLAETVQFCYQFRPWWFSKHPQFMKNFSKCVIVFSHLSFCAAYLTDIAGAAQLLTKDAKGKEKDLRLCLVMTMLPVIITALLRDLKHLTPISTISNMFLLSAVGIGIYQFVKDGLPPTSERIGISEPMNNWGYSFILLLFSFGAISFTLPLHNDMSKPEQFTSLLGVLNVGMTSAIISSAAFGFITYLKLGNDSSHIDFKDKDALKIMDIFMGCGIMFSYALQFHIVIDITWWDILNARKYRHVVSAEYNYRIIVALFTVIIALIEPEFGIFLSHIGSVLLSTTTLLFPALCEILLLTCPTEEYRMDSKDVYTRGMRLFFCGLSIFTTIMGFIITIIKSSVFLYYHFSSKANQTETN